MRIGNTPPGLFYKGSDRDFFEFATYYRVRYLCYIVQLRRPWHVKGVVLCKSRLVYKSLVS